MLPWFYLVKGYQTMQISLYDRRKSARETDSLDLMKINNVNSNVNQAEQSEANKYIRVITSAPNTGNTKMHSSSND